MEEQTSASVDLSSSRTAKRSGKPSCWRGNTSELRTRSAVWEATGRRRDHSREAQECRQKGRGRGGGQNPQISAVIIAAAAGAYARMRLEMRRQIPYEDDELCRCM